MRESLLNLLACPACRGDLGHEFQEVAADGDVVRGALTCVACVATYPIEGGIPRFVPRDNYASSFGYQWNLFKAEQLDSANGTDLSTQRFFTETGWDAADLAGKWVLDAGCGAGRFLDVAARTGAQVVGLDISTAIDASRSNLAGADNVHFVQASIFDLPFRADAFDKVYCIGVIQHTPDPAAALRSLPTVLKAGGEAAVTIYERKPWTKLNAKYLVRPLTRRMDKAQLLNRIRASMPILFPLTNVAFRAPVVGRLFEFAIPVANYVHEAKLTRKQRYDWAVLDTFDMLSPEFDQPQRQADVETALGAAGLGDLRRLPTGGLNIVGRKTAA